METINYIVVRIKDDFKIIFEPEFINNNQFETQNKIIEVLNLLYDKKDFSVDLRTKYFEK